MVKVRFAPSPTGHLHIGNARTAILNYLFAKKHKGVFILRIEDTDKARSNPEFTESILNDLLWLGIRWDEGPYLQSERLEIYKSYAERLINMGMAYKCFCSKERLSELREEWKRRKEPPKYDGRCRKLSESQRKELEAKGTPYVVRFLTCEKRVNFIDMIFGEISFPPGYVDDFILIKTDGTPSYNFAATIDDMLMGITHVIRGKDHIPNTPKQILLFEAFGEPHPSYAHHPLLVEKDGKPLSKREGSREIRSLREKGILPEAIFNYLSILGRKVEKEIMSVSELVESFSLDSISKSDAAFDSDKLLWFNRQHIRRLTSKEIMMRIGIIEEDPKIVDAIRENIETLSDVKEMMDIFKNPKITEEGINFLKGVGEAERIAEALKDSVENDKKMSFSSLSLKLKEKGISRTKENMLALRVLLTGRKAGPPIENILDFISNDVVLRRIECFKKSL